MAVPSIRRQGIVSFLCAVALVAAAVLWIREGESPQWFGWFGVVFFGAGGVVSAYMAITGKMLLRRTEPWRIELEPDGFAVVSHRGDRLPVRWAGIRRAFAYKRDLWSTDEIWVVFEMSEPSGTCQVSEEWPGFRDLFGPMESELGVSPGWYMKIMTPAFETTPTLIFERTGPNTTAAAS
jgi:hypothetical protein